MNIYEKKKFTDWRQSRIYSKSYDIPSQNSFSCYTQTQNRTQNVKKKKKSVYRNEINECRRYASVSITLLTIIQEAMLTISPIL